MDRYLRTAIRPAVAFEVDGVLSDPDGQAATVTITRADGTVVVTATPCTRVSTGVYRFNVTDEATLNRYTAVWAGDFGGDPLSITTEFETVGGFYVSLSGIRALLNLSDPDKFTVAKMVDARTWFEDSFEAYVGVAFVPRYHRATLDGSGTSTLCLPHMFVRRLIAASTIAGGVTTAYTAPEVADVVVRDTGYIKRRTLGVWAADEDNVTVEYEHGMDEPSADIRDAAELAIRRKLLEDNTGDRSTRTYSVATDLGIVRDDAPGPDRPFGIRKVDEVANRYRAMYRVPAIA